MLIHRRAVRRRHALIVVLALSVAGFGSAVQVLAQDASPQADPPSRVGYISLIEGTVSMHADGDANAPWAPATINYPMAQGTSLWTEPGAKAEIQIGAARIDLDGGTEVDIVAVDDQNVDFSVPQGRADIHLHGRQPNESYEATSPRGVAALTVDGTYRIFAGDDQNPTRIGALYGNAQLIVQSGSVPVTTNNELVVTAGDPLEYTQQALQDDDFDRWTAERMHRFDQPVAQHVSPQIVGAEDLGQYGTWSTTPEYGAVWVPSSVGADWAPYRDGNWRWVAPWGWTWVDDAPWGFAPFHYGRWARYRDRWAWCPGAAVERPVYAPAMVAFVGGDPGPAPGIGAAIGIGAGIGAAIGWVPLGPGEIYRPPYRVSPAYLRHVNVNNVPRAVINNITINRTVNHVSYANQRAATVVDHDAFVNARPIRNAALPEAQAARFTHPIMASAAPAGRPDGRPAGLPQPTEASRVGAAARPMQAPPVPRLRMPQTRFNAQGHVAPIGAPAVAGQPRRPGGPPASMNVPHPDVPRPGPAVAQPNTVPQPHPPTRPVVAPVPHPGTPNAEAQPRPVAQPHAIPSPPQLHPQAQPPQARPQAQPTNVPPPQQRSQPQMQPHPQPHAQPPAQPRPPAQPHPQPQAQPRPQAQPHPQQPRPQAQQPHAAPPQQHPQERRDEHPPGQ